MPDAGGSGERQLLLLVPAFYHSHLRKHFARWAMLFLVEHEHVRPALDGLPRALRQDVEASAFAPACWRRCDEMVYAHLMGDLEKREQEQFRQSLGRHEDAMRLINLAKSWLGTYLPHCVSKRCGVDYGTACSPKPSSRPVQRALLTPQGKHGSLYRCGQGVKS